MKTKGRLYKEAFKEYNIASSLHAHWTKIENSIWKMIWENQNQFCNLYKRQLHLKNSSGLRSLNCQILVENWKKLKGLCWWKINKKIVKIWIITFWFDFFIFWCLEMTESLKKIFNYGSQCSKGHLACLCLLPNCRSLLQGRWNKGLQGEQVLHEAWFILNSNFNPSPYFLLLYQGRSICRCEESSTF